VTEELTITTGPERRLRIGCFENAGRTLVTVAPQYMDQAGAWRLSHSGLILAPDIARELGPVLAAMAEAIDTDTAKEGGES
jgi:hypothetical protein